MKVLFLTIFALFTLIELFVWVKEKTNPLPFSIFAGAFLSLASNSEKPLFDFNHLSLKSPVRDHSVGVNHEGVDRPDN